MNLLIILIVSTVIFSHVCSAKTNKAPAEPFDIDGHYVNFTSARPFPLCLKSTTANEINDNWLQNNTKKVPYLEALRNALIFVNSTLDTNENLYVKLLPYHSVSVDRITVPVLRSYNLRQWLHVSINFTAWAPGTLLDFAIVQSVGSPLGVPFGEFRTDVECMDDEDLELNNIGLHKVENTYAIPCTYRPRSAVRHPNVLIVYTPPPGPPEEFSQIHFNFNWIQSMCQEITAMQFIILYHVKSVDFNTFETIMTPVFYIPKKDSLDGVPYPFYGGWNKSQIRCHGLHPNAKFKDKPENVTATKHPCHLKIVYNAEFDNCTVRANKTEGVAGRKGKTCPPGPFFCAKNWAGEAQRNKGVQTPGVYRATNVQEFFKENSKSWGACPYEEQFLEFPCNRTNRKNVTVTCIKKLHDVFEQDHQSAFLNRLSNKNHGLFMTATLLFQTLNVFIARFFKEAGMKGRLGFRFWLWAHFILTFLSVTTMWTGIGKAESVGLSGHTLIGSFSVIVYHANIATGFIRPIKQRKRNIFIIVHAVLGYLPQLLFLLASFVTSICPEHLIAMIFSQLIIIGLSLLFTFYLGIRGKKGVINKRKIVPVPEVLETRLFSKLDYMCTILPALSFLCLFAIAFLSFYKGVTLKDSDPEDAHCLIQFH